MTLGGRRIAVSIPDTILEEKDSPREKTVKLGAIARACAIYGVDVVEVFPGGGRGDWETIRKVLEYLETPQYLRRRLFPLDETLKYAGVLPPLRIPSHKPRVEVRDVKAGEVREGVAEADGTVDVGLAQRVKVGGNVPVGQRVTVRVNGTNPFIGKAVPRESAGAYWGYLVRRMPLGDVLGDKGYELKIATSRLGEGLHEAMPRVAESLKGARSVKLVFGSPSKGLFDLVGSDLKRVDYVLNLFPEQKVETVRSEEAIAAGLALLSYLMS